MSKIYVKITKCKSKDYWYADKIGEIFSVRNNPLTNASYIYLTKDNKSFIINKSDCEIIDNDIEHDDLKSENSKFNNSLSLMYKTSYEGIAFETKFLSVKNNELNVKIEEIIIKFGPHYYIQLFYDHNRKLKLNIGAIHHGIIVNANDVNGELERIIDFIRVNFKEFNTDVGIIEVQNL